MTFRIKRKKTLGKVTYWNNDSSREKPFDIMSFHDLRAGKTTFRNRNFSEKINILIKKTVRKNDRLEYQSVPFYSTQYLLLDFQLLVSVSVSDFQGLGLGRPVWSRTEKISVSVSVSVSGVLISVSVSVSTSVVSTTTLVQTLY